MNASVIEESDEARGAEKLMYGVNSLYQQVCSVHCPFDLQAGVTIQALPDYPCIEFSIRVCGIAKWQKAVKNLGVILGKKMDCRGYQKGSGSQRGGL